jgi:hypothetical protein
MMLGKSSQAGGKEFVIWVRLMLAHTKVISKKVAKGGANYICFSDG